MTWFYRSTKIHRIQTNNEDIFLKSKSIFIIAALLSLVIAIAGVFYWKREQDRQWRWAKIVMPERLARVPEEWSASTLGKRLLATKKIRDAATFQEAAAQAGLKTVPVGGYELPKEAGPDDLAKIFARGPSHQKLTFPEGWTVAQMSTRLAKNGFVSGTQLRTLAYPAAQQVSPLEGKLFPDTYWLKLKASAPQLASRLREKHDEIVAGLPLPFPKAYNDKRLTLNEVVILASLVERETDIHSERALVAGVLLKRLRDRMRLQCDASVQYALQRAALARGDETHQVPLRKDYKFPSPYNTYLNYGLPPAPICNPGRDSLEAAARPKATEYLFYVWSPKWKRHRFAKTFSEHKRNIALARSEE